MRLHTWVEQPVIDRYLNKFVIRSKLWSISLFKNNITAQTTMAVIMTLGLSACGGDDTTTSSGNSDCPPAPRSSLSAIQRAGGIENFDKYSKWQSELPPKSCAGALASYIPDLPEGYGLPPALQPPVMTDGHVYLKYVQKPPVDDGAELDLERYMKLPQPPQFEFEIVQLTADESKKFKDWFPANPKSYIEYNVEGRTFYGLGGGGWYRPGNKLMGGIGVILDNNILIKFSMPKIYADPSVPMPVAKLFHDIAKSNGQ